MKREVKKLTYGNIFLKIAMSLNEIALSCPILKIKMLQGYSSSLEL